MTERAEEAVAVSRHLCGRDMGSWTCGLLEGHKGQHRKASKPIPVPGIVVDGESSYLLEEGLSADGPAFVCLDLDNNWPGIRGGPRDWVDPPLVPRDDERQGKGGRPLPLGAREVWGHGTVFRWASGLGETVGGEDELLPAGHRGEIILLEAVGTEHAPPVSWDEAGPADYDAGVVHEGLLSHLDWSRQGDGLEREWFWSRYKWLKRHHPRLAYDVRRATSEREDPARGEEGAALLITGAVADWLDLDEDETQNLAHVLLDKIKRRPTSNPWRRVTIKKVE